MSQSTRSERPTRPEVVVTGLGAVTPLGVTMAETWAGVREARSGARLLDEEWAAALPVRIGAPVDVPLTELIDRVEARRLDRSGAFAMVATREAWADAGSPDIEPERLAVAVSTGIGGMTTLLANYDALCSAGPRRVSPLAVPMLMPNGAAGAVALELHARAGAHSPVSACSSGAESVAMGLDIIRAGRADVVVVGGTEACLHPLPLAAFAAMRALSTREDDPQSALRPFDKGRDGFVLGEGAAVLVLERADYAAARGARIYGRVLGAGLTSDAYHIAAPEPTGAGAARAVTLALADAGISPADVAHVNAHATGTPAGDKAEAGALVASLGEHVSEVKVSATKGATGHLLGAAGSLEAALSLLALNERSAPPTRNADDLDDDCPLDVVRVSAAPLPEDALAVSTSFGFGGHNVALVLAGAA